MPKELAREILRRELHTIRFLSEHLLPDGVADIIKIPRHEKINSQINWLQKVAEESLVIDRNQLNLEQLRDNIAATITKDGTPLDNLGNLTDGYKIGEKYVWFRYTYDTVDIYDNPKPWEMTGKGFTLTVSDDIEKHSNSDAFDGHAFDSYTPKGQIKSIHVSETTPEGIFKKYEPRTLRTASIIENENMRVNLGSWSEVIETINQIIPNLPTVPQK